MINKILSLLRKKKFPGTAQYWESRYQSGRTSGAGSYGQLAKYKADFINSFVAKNQIQSLIEYGSGDGAQLELAHYPKYIGIDISETAVKWCKEKFANDDSKSFYVWNGRDFQWSADLALSLDVLYHLIEDETYHNYLKALFGSSTSHVIIYSVDKDQGNYAQHVKPRKFTSDIKTLFPSWNLVLHEPNPFPLEKFGAENGSWSDFYVYSKAN
jgi:cyclopropane fatty-acyl-phospholipid synthase-like methyltransferase